MFGGYSQRVWRATATRLGISASYVLATCWVNMLRRFPQRVSSGIHNVLSECLRSVSMNARKKLSVMLAASFRGTRGAFPGDGRKGPWNIAMKSREDLQRESHDSRSFPGGSCEAINDRIRCLATEKAQKHCCMSGQTLRVSAVIPVKNGSPHFAECLDSILGQILTPELIVEVSIYDDGSTDGTTDIAAQYKSKFLRRGISFVFGSSNYSRGVGYAKNRSVQQCSGSVLVFCDADDISLKHRIISVCNALRNASRPELTLVGSGFERIPFGSTFRYTQWANTLSRKQIYDQIFTSHGPSLVAPTWCMSRKLYDSIGGFHEAQSVGYPEDLRFFYDAVKLGAEFVKVEDSLVIYRYHPKCASLVVTGETIWKMRVGMFEELVLTKWEKFMIWGAGKVGRRFYRALTDKNRRKVTAFCDIDEKKLHCGRYEHFDPGQRRVIAVVPVIPLNRMVPPIAVCLKMDLIDSEEVNQVFRTHKIVEGRDYFCLG